MSAPFQRRFEFDLQLSPKRPLLSVNTAMAWLDLDEDGVNHLVEDGRIEWAFNIAVDESGKRRELRLWRDAILAYLLRQSGGVVEIGGDVPGRIVGHGREMMRMIEVKRLLNCGGALVYRLLEAGEFKLAGARPSVKTGPNASATITTQSFREFLHKRRQ